MAATIKEIAQRANVSIATVSRALNDDGKVKDKTRQIILTISEEMNYNPNLLARNFVKKTSNIVGLILPDISDEFFTEVIRGVDEITYSLGYYTMVASSHRNRSIVESIRNFSGNGLVGGVILLIPSLTPEIKKAITNNTIPVVIITGDAVSDKYDIISINNYQGSYNLTSYLIKEKKYSEIAYISGPSDNSDAKQRQKGFLKACEDNQIAIKPEWLMEGDFTKEKGEECAKILLECQGKPRLIIAANDMMALGCYEEAMNIGLKIPEDIGVAGFDDILVSKFLSPGLTTVKVNIAEVGKKAASLVMDRINSSNIVDEGKRKKIKGLKINIPTELVFRGSC